MEEGGWDVVVGYIVLAVVHRVLLEMQLREKNLLEVTEMASCLASLSIRPCLKRRAATSDSNL